MTVRGKSGNSDLLGERERGVIIYSTGDSYGGAGRLQWYRLRTSDTLNLSHGPLLCSAQFTMGDHITDDSGQTCSVFIPRLSSECGEYDINGGGDIRAILKHFPPQLCFVFSVAVGCDGCENVRLIKRSVSCGVTPSWDRQATARAGPHKRVTNYNTFRPDNCELNNNTNQHQQHERLEERERKKWRLTVSVVWVSRVPS